MRVPLAKVKPGDPLVTLAETHNAFVDAARAHQQRRHDGGPVARGGQRQADVVLVRNDSGAARDRFDVLGINGPITTPVENEDEFASRVLLSGVVPTAGHAGQFVILLEPVPAGEFARACISGVCAARVRLIDEAHTYADVEVDVAAELQSAGSGGAQLLWIEPVEDRTDPYVARTVVRIGGGGGTVQRAEAEITGFGTGNRTFLCKLAVDGSLVGDEFEVYARSYDFDNPGLIGEVDLTNCFPNYVVGDAIVIERATFRCGGETKTGWWCTDPFQPYECETG